MKRFLIMLLATVLLLSSTSCGSSSKSSSPYNEQCQAAFKAVATTLDDVLNYKTNLSDAVTKLQKISDSLDGSADTLQKTAKNSIDIAITSLNNIALSRKIDSIGTSKSGNLNSDDFQKIKEIRDKFASK